MTHTNRSRAKANARRRKEAERKQAPVPVAEQDRRAADRAQAHADRYPVPPSYDERPLFGTPRSLGRLIAVRPRLLGLLMSQVRSARNQRRTDRRSAA